MGQVVSMKQVQAMMKYFDGDQSGDIDFQEFQTLMESVMPSRELYDVVMGDAEFNLDVMAANLGTTTWQCFRTTALPSARRCERGVPPAFQPGTSPRY